MFDVTNSMRVVESALQATGRFTNVQIGEPKAVVDGDGFVAGVFMDHADVVDLSLSTSTELHVLTVRIYKNALAEPQDYWEIELSKIVNAISDLFYGDFTLGGEVESIDFGGRYGGRYAAMWAYGDVNGPIFRVADITLPLIVHSSIAMTA
jgi:hypothetical protein